MNKAVILVWNNFTNDKRVMNIASVFADDFDCTVLAAKTIYELPTRESKLYKIYRIPLISALKKSTPAKSIRTNHSSKNRNSLYNRILKNNRLKLIVLEFLNVVKYEIGVLKFILAEKPKVVYCNDLDTLGIGYYAAKIVKAKVIYDSHEIFLDGSRYSQATRLRKWLWRSTEKKLITKVKNVIVTTDYRKKLIEENYQINNVNVIRNCHPKTAYKKHNLFRSEFNIPETIPILLYQGGLTEVRGIFTIVDIVEEIDNIAMIFMGMGKDLERLATYIKSKNIEDKIFVKNAVAPAELIKYTSSADIGLQLLQNINANHYSTISNKIFEYMTAGLAIVASDFPEIRKIVLGYNIGKVIDPSSNEDIKLAIESIISDSKLLNTMKSNSQNAAILNTWELEEVKLKEIISKVLI